MQTHQVKVFVVDSEGIPLLPTTPRRARKLLDSDKASVRQVIPFTIQLKRRIDNPVGSFTLGIDDGARTVGVSIVNDKKNEVVFRGQLDLRQDVSRKMKERAQYRRSRRSRNLRYRKPRFDNRKGSRIAPSIRCRKDSILRFVKDMSKKVKLVRAIVEEVNFNHAKHNWGKPFSLVEIGKSYLRDQIKSLGLHYEAVFGYQTKEWRIGLGLSKLHSNDAISLVCRARQPIISSMEYFVKPRRAKIWGNNPTKVCEERHGFRPACRSGRQAL